MRSYQITYLIIFLIFYVLLSVATYKSVSQVLKVQNQKLSKFVIFSYSLLIMLGFVFIYIWLGDLSANGNYTSILILNVFLSADFAFKIVSAFAFLIGFMFSQKYRAIISWCGLIISLGIIVNVFFSSAIEKNQVVVNNIDIEYENLPHDFDGYKIMQISDIHLGSYMHSKKNLQKTSEVIQQINADILFFTGDLVNNYSEEIKGWGNVFKSLNKGIKSISILGNHDYGDYSEWDSNLLKEENFDQILEAHNQFGFQLLRNESTVLRKGADSIFVVGVENWGHPPFPQYANLDKALNGIPKESFKILLSHDPAHWESVVKTIDNIDLTLSGHTHGMQWGIKKAGITFSLMYFVINSWGGLYTNGNSKLYVNTGLGMIGFPWRINMPGEITLITLKRIKVDGK